MNKKKAMQQKLFESMMIIIIFTASDNDYIADICKSPESKIELVKNSFNIQNLHRYSY